MCCELCAVCCPQCGAQSLGDTQYQQSFSNDISANDGNGCRSDCKITIVTVSPLLDWADYLCLVLKEGEEHGPVEVRGWQ